MLVWNVANFDLCRPISKHIYPFWHSFHCRHLHISGHSSVNITKFHILQPKKYLITAGCSCTVQTDDSTTCLHNSQTSTGQYRSFSLNVSSLGVTFKCPLVFTYFQTRDWFQSGFSLNTVHCHDVHFWQQTIVRLHNDTKHSRILLM